MTYIPRRDYRFEYVTEAISFVEERQCIDCFFKESGEFPMCMEIQGNVMLEEPIEEWSDLGDEGLLCNKYRNEVVAGNEVNQEKLF